MGNITIRQLDDAATRNASQVAAAKGRSLEAELRDLIESTYGAVDERVAGIRAMSGPEFVQHLIRTANGASLEPPERRTDTDRDVFGAD